MLDAINNRRRIVTIAYGYYNSQRYKVLYQEKGLSYGSPFCLFASITCSFMKPKEEVIMDEMRLKLSTKFMRGIVAKLVSKAIYSKTGYKCDIQLNEIVVKTVDGKIRLHADVDAEINNDEFMKIIKSVGLD